MKRSIKTTTLLVGALLGAAIFTGCVSQEPPPPPPPPPPVPASTADVETIRNALAASFPNVKVAAVNEVVANAPYLAAYDINPADFPLESIVTILNGSGASIAHGRVEALVNNQAHIRFDVDAGVDRRPQLGDVVVLGLKN